MKNLRFSAFRYKKEDNSEWKMKKILYLCESKNTIETKERIGMKRVFSLSILFFTITITAFGQKLMPEDFFSFGKAKEIDVNKIMRQSGFESTYRVLPPSTPDSPKITDLCYSIACKFDSEFNVLPPYDAITGCVKVSFIGKHIALAMYQTTDRMLFGEYIKMTREQLFQKFDITDDETGRTTAYRKGDIMLSFKEGNDGLYTIQCDYPLR